MLIKGGLSGGAIAGIVIGVLLAAVLVGGVAYFAKSRFMATPNSSNSGGSLGDRVSFNNPLSATNDVEKNGGTDTQNSNPYNTIYDNDFGMPSSTGTSNNAPSVKDGVLFLGSDAWVTWLEIDLICLYE